MIDLEPNEEQAAVVEAIRDFLHSELPLIRLNPAHPGQKQDRDCWKSFADMGWFQIGLPADAGGLGLGVAGDALACLEFGAMLLTPSVPAAIVATNLLAGDEHRLLREAIVAGERRCALALRAGAREEAYVFEATDETVIVLIENAGVRLIEAASLSKRESLPGLDETLGLQAVALAGSKTLLASPAGDPRTLRASLLLAATLAGIAAGVRDLSVRYAIDRQQFGRPIGSFQAIKHMCSDMATRAAAARAQVLFAAASFGSDEFDSAGEVAAASHVAAQAAVLNGTHAIQLHGGMGFTVECLAHVFLKRAQILARANAAPARDAVLLAAA